MASTFNAAQGDTEAEKHDREQRRRQLHDVPLQATGGPDVWPRWEFMDEKLGPNGDLKTHMSSQMRTPGTLDRCLAMAKMAQSHTITSIGV